MKKEFKRRVIDAAQEYAAEKAKGKAAAKAFLKTDKGKVLKRAAGMAGATAAGLTPPMVLGVSVLTSEKSATPEKLQERISNLVAADCGGIVCAASDLLLVTEQAPELLSVVPGIRPEGVSNNDQGRPATPSTAIQEGAGLLVIGRAVTASADLEQAANAIALEVSDAL